MRNKAQELSAIVKLTEAAYTAEQSHMAGLKLQETELRAKLEALKPSHQYASSELANDPARRAGADILWQRWADSRRSALNIELARTLVAQAQAKSSLAKAFGRREAMKQVHQDVRSSIKADMVRRADRNG